MSIIKSVSLGIALGILKVMRKHVHHEAKYSHAEEATMIFERFAGKDEYGEQVEDFHKAQATIVRGLNPTDVEPHASRGMAKVNKQHMQQFTLSEHAPFVSTKLKNAEDMHTLHTIVGSSFDANKTALVDTPITSQDIHDVLMHLNQQHSAPTNRIQQLASFVHEFETIYALEQPNARYAKTILEFVMSFQRIPVMGAVEFVEALREIIYTFASSSTIRFADREHYRKKWELQCITYADYESIDGLRHGSLVMKRRYPAPQVLPFTTNLSNQLLLVVMQMYDGHFMS